MERLLIRSALALGAAALLGGCGALARYRSGLAELYALEASLPGSWVEKVYPGVVYARWTEEGPRDWQIIEIDLSRKDLYLRPLLASGRIDGGRASREPLSRLARRQEALAAVSGDYRAGALNVAGLVVIDGRVHLAPYPVERSAVAVLRDGSARIGRLHPDRPEDFGIFQALGGGPQLLRDGAFRWERGGDGRINAEDFSRVEAPPADEPEPFAALCLRAGGRTMLWIYAEPPHEDSLGATPGDLGSLLARLECRDALRLAGGPGAGIAVRGRRVGRDEGPETPIGSAWGVFRVRGAEPSWLRRPAWRSP